MRPMRCTRVSPARLQHQRHAIGIVGRAADDHADPHVEGAVHVVLRHAPDALEIAEDRVGRPGGLVDQRSGARREDARQVLGDPAAGDVREPFDEPRLEERPDHGQIRPVDAEQLLADRAPEFVDHRVRLQAEVAEDDGAGEGVAVGVEARRAQAEQDVTRPQRCAGDEAVPFDHADDEARDVVLAFRVEARHLGRLAADEGAPVLEAGGRDAFHHPRDHVGRERAGGEVVQEEQRFGALHEDVVDAVVDEALPHGVVAPGHERHLQLRADAVRARHEDRVAVVRAEPVQAAEGADGGQHARRERAFRQPLDAVDGLSARADVDAALLVVHGADTGQKQDSPEGALADALLLLLLLPPRTFRNSASWRGNGSGYFPV